MKNTQKTEELVSMMIGASITGSPQDDALSAILAEIEEDLAAPPSGTEEILVSSEKEIDISSLASVVAGIETREIAEKIIHDEDDAINALFVPPVVETPIVSDGEIDIAALLSEPGHAAAVAASEPKPKKEKKARQKKEKPEGEGETESKAKREYFGKDKVRRIETKLGDQLGDYMVLTLSDAALEGEALKVAQRGTLDVINAMGEKVKNRATLLIEFIAGRRSSCNEIMLRALTILKKDGVLTRGAEGNLHKDLLARPYAENSARSMGDNTLRVLVGLKMVVPGEKNSLIANPESLLLMKANSLLEL